MIGSEEHFEADLAEGAGLPGPRSRRRWPMVLGLMIVAAALALGYAWHVRNDLARDVISGRLDKLGLPASYTVESIGTDRQVLSHIVIGDPARPDLTIESAVIAISPRWGAPALGRITLVRPRLFGRYHAGKLSFGSLDRVIFTGSGQPLRLPDLDLAIADGRALMETDTGPIGIKLEGSGGLRGGFSGVVAAVAPRFDADGCRAESASLFGRITVASERPHFSGPLRLAGLTCQGAALRQAAVQLDAVIDSTFDGGEGRLSLKTGAAVSGSLRTGSVQGNLAFAARAGAVTASYDLKARAIQTGQVSIESLGAEGVLRSHENFARYETEGSSQGIGIGIDSGLDRTLAHWQASAANSLAVPLIVQARSAIRRESPGSVLTARYILRRTGNVTSLIVPQGSLTGGSGAVLLGLSRFEMTATGQAGTQFAGNFTTGGAGLPQIAGRAERRTGRDLAMHMSMAQYRAGSASLEVPEMVAVLARSGAVGFAGSARLSGEMPAGRASNLALPVEGSWSPGGGLAVWRKCTALRFDSLTLANLTIQRHDVTVCPQNGGAILRSDARGTRLAAGMASLDLAGRLGSTTIRIASGPVGFAVPGAISARRLDIALGSAANASRFRIGALKGRATSSGSDGGFAGQFDGTDVFLNSVPLDILGAGGAWRYVGGHLEIGAAAFRLEDRQGDDRFQPLVARDAGLRLANDAIVAHAALREPRSDRVVSNVTITHNITSGTGHAELAVDGIRFDRSLQPDTLTRRALGVIANARGTVRGHGEITWTAQKVASSGVFSTDSLDFAAAFGPVKGVSGSSVFTDLLGLVTAPDQRLKIASINPGIEAGNGELSFELKPDSVLQINGAHWPFLDGRLSLEPTRMVLGAAETRRYVLGIEGLDAARFLQRMELGNISASGSFDGKLPLVFDENGGRIEGGLLISRPPGGNVSYVGTLTYKDMGAMANFAFDALKSLDYKQMRIAMDGALEGEIVTRVRFTGVKQGAGARRNFITRRLGNLPIQFNINLRAPFHQLITSFKSIYDPGYVPDPRTLGLIGADGQPVKRQPPVIQPPVSETRP